MSFLNYTQDTLVQVDAQQSVTDFLVIPVTDQAILNNIPAWQRREIESNAAIFSAQQFFQQPPPPPQKLVWQPATQPLQQPFQPLSQQTNTELCEQASVSNISSNFARVYSQLPSESLGLQFVNLVTNQPAFTEPLNPRKENEKEAENRKQVTSQSVEFVNITEKSSLNSHTSKNGFINGISLTNQATTCLLKPGGTISTTRAENGISMDLNHLNNNYRNVTIRNKRTLSKNSRSNRQSTGFETNANIPSIQGDKSAQNPTRSVPNTVVVSTAQQCNTTVTNEQTVTRSCHVSHQPQSTIENHSDSNLTSVALKERFIDNEHSAERTLLPCVDVNSNRDCPPMSLTYVISSQASGGITQDPETQPFIYHIGDETQKVCLAVATSEFPSSIPPENLKDLNTTTDNPVIIHLTASQGEPSQEEDAIPSSNDLFDFNENAEIAKKMAVMRVKRKLHFSEMAPTVNIYNEDNMLVTPVRPCVSPEIPIIQNRRNQKAPVSLDVASASGSKLHIIKPTESLFQFTSDEMKEMLDCIWNIYTS